MPSKLVGASDNDYNVYPVYSIGKDKVHSGVESFVQWLITQRNVKIDGYIGVDWAGIKNTIMGLLEERGVRANWIDAAEYLKSEVDIDAMVAPFLGEEDSVWGKKTDLALADFLFTEQIEGIRPSEQYQVTIIGGIGASYAAADFTLAYFDLPKNELLFRMRGGSANNIGTTATVSHTNTYKRFFFVDWEVLNKRKKELLNRISAYVDTQWPDTMNWIGGADLLAGLSAMSKTVFRPRPWFDPGIWGGQWMKEKFKQLGDEDNYAWSFEIIAPENGIVLESSGKLLEVTFDMLMFAEGENVLGSVDYKKFDDFFPIRFDFLDTFDGGNLSIQSHPSNAYIKDVFGQAFTQDETYYILDCKDGANVYLGFKDDINPDEFRSALEESVEMEKPVDVERFVQTFQSKKHDFFLIPNQTIHSSGKNNMVLEISATPYIFTFKMYDWLQRDSNGKPRPINITHGFNNLDFSRKGKTVEEELISKPYVLQEGDGYQIIHYPTHREHYYHVYRFDISDTIKVKTEDKAHVLMLVEGSKVEVEDANGKKSVFNYAETFIIPAKAGEYQLRNLGENKAKVIQASVK